MLAGIKHFTQKRGDTNYHGNSIFFVIFYVEDTESLIAFGCIIILFSLPHSVSVTSLPVAYISLCSVFTFHFISVFYLQLNFEMHLFELSAFENQEAHSEEDFRFEKSLKVSLFNRISISLFSSYVLNVKILGGCRNSKICGLSFIMLLITVKQHSCRSRRKKSELLLHR